MRPLRVLQINAADVVGRRFNNLDAFPLLAASGIESRMLVRERRSDRPDVQTFLPRRIFRSLNERLSRMEAARSLQSRFQLQSFLLALHPWFRWADVVHYHLIHDFWFSLDALPLLSRLRPAVWTFHDPWMMTGHCLYPMDCTRWQIGCGHCPALDRPFAMKVDKSAEQHAFKRKLIGQMDVDIVLASRNMLDMAKASPIAAGKRLHLLPFGIDLTEFRPEEGTEARARLGIQPGRLVILFRGAVENPFKGVPTLLSAIERLPECLPPLCLLVTHGSGVAHHLAGRHQVVELGWVDDQQTLVDSNVAADIVVIPSLAEAFGLMAIEAMACGKPVIVGAGTALTEVTAAPEIGLPVDPHDVDALAGAITRLAISPEERFARGAAGRKLVERRYDIHRFSSELASFYRAAATRRTA